MAGNVRNSRTTHPNKQRRQEEAAVRQEAYDKLPIADKVAQAGTKQLNKFVARGGEIGELAQKRLDEAS